MMAELQCDTCLHADRVLATDQELVADVLIALLYVQGLDLSVGDAGTVLVKGGKGRVRSTGETCPTRTRKSGEETRSLEVEGDKLPRGGQEGGFRDAASIWEMGCEGTYRAFFLKHWKW